LNPYLPFSAHGLKCTACKKEYHQLQPFQYCCSCGSPFGIIYASSTGAGRITKGENILQKYSGLWQVPPDLAFLSLGEGNTPIHTFKFGKRMIHGKLEYLSPSGSYKDRGAALMISLLKFAGVSEIIEDSSGNAGGSVAAYSAAAGISCSIYCPESASGGKLSFIQSCGANLLRIAGHRENAAAEALKKAAETVYASHVWNPWFTKGVRSIAYEIFEQRAELPDEIIMPLGNGALFLGVFQGLQDLLHHGYINKMPLLIGVQAESVSPLYHLWKGEKSPKQGKTIAEGIANAEPPRAAEIVEAVRNCQGEIITISEKEIIDAWKEGIRSGILIEPTSAVVLAAELKMKAGSNRLHILTGSLLKTPGVLGLLS